MTSGGTTARGTRFCGHFRHYSQTAFLLNAVLLLLLLFVPSQHLNFLEKDSK